MKFYNQLLESPKPTLERMELCQRLSKLPTVHLQNVYLLVLHHVASHQISDIGALSMGNTGIKFNMSKFPDDLVAIISSYVQHISN